MTDVDESRESADPLTATPASWPSPSPARTASRRCSRCPGAHVFPMYDGAVKADPPMRLLDVRHEQTAAFAAEATGKLTRVPGLAVLTAGPGRDQRRQRDRAGPVRRLADGRRRRPRARRTAGAAAASRSSTSRRSSRRSPSPPAPLHTAGDVLDGMHEAFAAAGSSHRGPVFVDVPMDEFFNSADGHAARRRPVARRRPRPRRDRPRSPSCSPARARPVLILGTDVWADGAEEAALRFVEAAGIPAITNGMGRGVVPGGHPLLVTKARGAALGGADLVVVVGTPLDFRLGYGVFGGKDGATPAQVVHVADSPGQVSGHADLAALGVRRPDRRSSTGCWPPSSSGPTARLVRLGRRPPGTPWPAAAERDAELLGAEADPIHPARIYGELVPRLADDAVVIGDGGDFVSFAGKFVEPKRPGGWLDPGPYGCLGAGLGAAIAARLARPSRAGRAAARRRRRRLLADGRRHPGPPQPAGRDGDGQQLRVGPGEGPDADALRLRRGRRPGRRRPATTRSSRRSAAPARRSPTRARSVRRSTGRSPRTCPTSST